MTFDRLHSTRSLRQAPFDKLREQRSNTLAEPVRNMLAEHVGSMLVEHVETNTNMIIMKGWMYILECADGTYYTGSTIDLKRRIQQHQKGMGANHTKKTTTSKIGLL